MIRRKMTTAGRNVKIAVSLITGMLLAGALAAGSAFAADASSVSDGRDVEITYLNDAEADEEVLMEGAVYAITGFNITRLDDSTISVEGLEDQPWTGNPVTLPDLYVKRTWQKYPSTPTKYTVYFPKSNYTVAYANNTDPGTASVIITGKNDGDKMYGGLAGEITKTFMIILPLININDPAVEITGITDQTWTGNPVTLPDLKVLFNNNYQFPADQYTVTYMNNTSPGTASVTITGTGTGSGASEGLNGSVTKTFQIIKPETEAPQQGTETPQKESETPQEGGGIPVATTVISGKGASQASYTVTSNDTGTSTGTGTSVGTVTFTKTMASANAKSIKVPDTVVLNGKTYQVTAISKKAFNGMKKLKKLTIGANVTSIGASAFTKCPNLKTLIIKSKLLTAAKCKKCLKGSSINTVKVPKSKKKAYKKIFTKKVCGRKVTVK